LLFKTGLFSAPFLGQGCYLETTTELTKGLAVTVIERLTEANQELFLEFMDGRAFSSQPQWQGCYCQFYLNTRDENAAENSSSEVNRQRACDRIANKVMNGYLALTEPGENQKVVGWMAANKSLNFVELPPQPEDVAAIICFVVDQDFQGRGVASELLRFGLNDLPTRGFKTVLAAPLAGDEFATWGYRGPRSMFEKAGFQPGPMIDDRHVLMVRELS
jgi:ribosomal protein S18 acetylase RimI-like enzyme